MNLRAPFLAPLLLAGFLAAPPPHASAIEHPTSPAFTPPVESNADPPQPGRTSRPFSIRGRESDHTIHPGSSPGSLGPTMMTLTVLLLAIGGAAAWVVRRSQLVARTANDPAIRLIARAGVAPRQAIVLVQIGSERLVLGVGGQGPPSLLARWPESGSENLPS